MSMPFVASLCAAKLGRESSKFQGQTCRFWTSTSFNSKGSWRWTCPGGSHELRGLLQGLKAGCDFGLRPRLHEHLTEQGAWATAFLKVWSPVPVDLSKLPIAMERIWKGCRLEDLPSKATREWEKSIRILLCRICAGFQHPEASNQQCMHPNGSWPRQPQSLRLCSTL